VKKLEEFDITRGIAIFAVVVIHATAEATIAYPVGTLKYLLYNIINSLVQFAVPLFLFVSSVVLSWKMTKEEVILTTFYRKRFKTAVLPYLIWSFLYIALKAIRYRGMTKLTWNFLGNELLNGTAFYHLYFLLIIMQLYLFLPFVCRLLKKLRLSGLVFWTVVLQVAFYIINKKWLSSIYPHPANLLGGYLSVFIPGCWVGLNYEKVKEVLQKSKYRLLIIDAVFTILFVIINISLRRGVAIGLLTYYGTYHLFALITSLSVWIISFQGQVKRFSHLGIHSFAIYLVHPFFLEVWYTLWRKAGFAANDLLFITAFIFTIGFSYGTSIIISKSKILGRLLLAR
jgi:surface polysaccharide O-acyltransferase-like enzyme